MLRLVEPIGTRRRAASDLDRLDHPVGSDLDRLDHPGPLDHPIGSSITRSGLDQLDGSDQVPVS
jgi:hypothetical protein